MIIGVLLGILTTVLKVIGITLLCILGVILLLLLLLLFVPVRYKADGIYNEEEKDAKAIIHWLFHIIHGSAVYKDKKVNIKVRLFGIPVFKMLLPDDNKSDDDLELEDDFESDDDMKDNIEEDSKKSKKEKKERKKKDKKLKNNHNKDSESEGLDIKEVNLTSEVEEEYSDELEEDLTDDEELNTFDRILTKVLNTFFNGFDYCLHGFFSLFDFILLTFFKIFVFILNVFGKLLGIVEKITIPEFNTLDTIEKKVNSVVEAGDKLGEKISNINLAIGKVGEKIKGFFGKVKNIPTKVSDIKSKINSIKDKINRIKNKANNTKNRISDYKKLAETKRFKKTFAFAKKELFKLLKHILPRKFKGYVNFGFEEPDKTGRIYGIIAILYGMFNKKLKKFDINPDFNRKVIEGEIHLKGHIRLIWVLIVAIKVLLNRNIWILKKKFDKINDKYEEDDETEGYEEALGA